MSTTATIINPMISKQQQQQQTIKQEILSDLELIKSEDESSVEVGLAGTGGGGGGNGSSSNGIGAVAAAAAAAAAASGGKCILYISSSNGGNLTVCKTTATNNSSSSSTTSEESLDVKNGHNYSSNKANNNNNTGNGHHNNHHPHSHNNHNHHQVNTSNGGGLQRQQQHHLNSTVTTTANNSNNNNRPLGKRIDFAKQQQQQLHHGSNNNNLDLYSTPGSLEHSPSSSPLSFNAESSSHHPQDMFCSSTVGGDHGGHHLLDTTTDSSSANGNGGAKGSAAAASSRGDGSPKRLCLVCGDTASGFHYGVASCEACKAFFKRTIQGNIEYTCPATNNCEINKRRRKACQACRFQKCLRMGMLKEGVRLDRVRGGRQKYRRTSEAPYGHVGSGGGHGGGGANACGVNGFGLKKTSIDDNRIVAALISCEPEAIVLNSSLMSSPSSSSGGSFASVSSSQYKNLSILSELVDKELVATIGWAKQIPSFSELTLNDQMRLLQSTWAEILALSLAFRSHQYSSPPNTPAGLSPNNASSTTTPIFNKLVFATDYILDDQAAAQCNAEAFFGQMIALIGRLHQMKIAKEEYLLMKAIILTNADIPLENYERVAKLRETLVHALQETVSILRPNGAVVGHLSQLFLCLPLLRQLDAVTRSLWMTVLKEGSVPMNKLFIEMLETRVLA